MAASLEPVAFRVRGPAGQEVGRFPVPRNSHGLELKRAVEDQPDR